MKRPSITLAAAIAETLDWRRRLESSPDADMRSAWLPRAEERLSALAEELPSGSGLDSGTKIDIGRSTAYRLVLTTSYHHMHESGMYDGWTDHDIIVEPGWTDIRVRVTGRDRNQIKDYLAELFSDLLSALYKLADDGFYHPVPADAQSNAEE